MTLTLPLVTSAAIIDSINPCAISVLLLTIGFLISLNKSRRQVFAIAGTYILGIFITYILIGLGVLSALTFFGIPRVISKIGASVLILTGVINLLDHFIPDFPIHLVIPQFTKPKLANLMQQASFPAAFIMGILVGLFEFPCTGGPYLLILTLLHDKSTLGPGALYLIYYNFIFVLPLILILIATNSSLVLSRVQSYRKDHLKILDLLSSLAMVALGVLIFLL